VELESVSPGARSERSASGDALPVLEQGRIAELRDVPALDDESDGTLGCVGWNRNEAESPLALETI
jgi:hypothetical protein